MPVVTVILGLIGLIGNGGSIAVALGTLTIPEWASIAIVVMKASPDILALLIKLDPVFVILQKAIGQSSDPTSIAGQIVDYIKADGNYVIQEYPDNA